MIPPVEQPVTPPDITSTETDQSDNFSTPTAWLEPVANPTVTVQPENLPTATVEPVYIPTPTLQPVNSLSFINSPVVKIEDGLTNLGTSSFSFGEYRSNSVAPQPVFQYTNPQLVTSSEPKPGI